MFKNIDDIITCVEELLDKHDRDADEAAFSYLLEGFYPENSDGITTKQKSTLYYFKGIIFTRRASDKTNTDEKKEMEDTAIDAFQSALKENPDNKAAQKELDNLKKVQLQRSRSSETDVEALLAPKTPVEIQRAASAETDRGFLDQQTPTGAVVTAAQKTKN